MSAVSIQQRLRSLASPTIAEHSLRFFKTGKGEYGEGDQFLGLRVPALRAEVKRSHDEPLGEIQKILHSPYHEERLFALYVLVKKFGLARKDKEAQRKIYQLYLESTLYINNWDLVDSSAYQIIGGYLLDKSRKPLYRLAKSDGWWERRISMIACFQFIRHNDLDDALELSKQFLLDEHDLMHKAVGWMLREVGKRDESRELQFLDQYYTVMPRTMLRYAIEKFSPEVRASFLSGTR
ncbi:DNA alkylation repair protein [Teredinibacter purpureus]|uniref:DNA alkylation repair protein n=1 Tax=Teredinibacter purpureus TaxID=2731756 RepID=UPI0005F87405|nr:DNA alkylation repair protein [Teredinibacter purpureus]